MRQFTSVALSATYLCLALIVALLLWRNGGGWAAGVAALVGGLGLCFAVHGLISQSLKLRALRKELDAVREAQRVMLSQMEQVDARMTEDADAVSDDAGRSEALEGEVHMLEDLVQRMGQRLEERVSAGARQAPHEPTLRRHQSAALLDTVREALAENRVDLYLQPVVGLPQRRTVFYESYSRLRDATGRVMMPAEYLAVAEPEGLVTSIDNLLLFRCVQIVRRLAKQDRKVGIFCNISIASLADETFFPQFLELLLCDMQFPSGIEIDRVDEEVGMDVLTVCVGADQNFVSLIVLGQLQRGRVSGDRVDCFAFREALYHVIEQYTVRLVVEPLGGHEIRVDRFRLTVDTCDQLLPLELGLFILHGIPHHGAHASGGLAPLVVCEADDSHSLPALSFKDHPYGTTEFRERPTYAFQIDHGHSSHVRQGDELVQISADGLQLLQHFFQAVDDHHLLSQAAGSDVVAHGHPGLLRQLLDGLPVCGRHAGAEFNIFFHVVSSKS